ncbi:MAG: alpha/beta fold hydrolase [Nitriliruptorales bacterium]
MAPASSRTSGYANIDGLEMYYERHGHGAPLVLLHGAFGTIESCFAGLLPLLANHYEVIAVELQGHGRTRDVDKPFTCNGMAADTAALLEALDVSRAHIVGYSLGGAVGLLLALDRPDLVDRLVYFGGVSFDPSGVYPQLTTMFESSFDPHQLDGTRWHDAYRRVAPDPEAWIPLVEKVNALDRAGFTVPRERLAGLQPPTLLMIGDADVVLPEHVVELFRLIGGGVPGDLVPLPPSQLAILPGTNHVEVLDRVEWVSSMIVAFLAPSQA